MSSENSNLDWVRYAYVGMKVVCVYPITSRSQTRLSLWQWLVIRFPKKGDICTISSIGFNPKGVPWIEFKEYSLPSDKGFNPFDFKPVRSTKQGMETLNAILLTKPVNQKSNQKDKEPSLASILPGGDGRLYFSPASPTKGSGK